MSVVRRSRLRSAVLLAVLLIGPPAAAASAQQPGAEIIRGVVRSLDDDTPIADARVTITGLRSFTRRTVLTSANGHYTIVFGDPEGEYVVSVGAIGYARMTERVARAGETTLLVVDVLLPRVIVHLDSLVVYEGPPVDTLGSGDERDVLDGSLFSLDPSSISDLMARAPGVATIPDLGQKAAGHSVLGVSPDQNSVVLDGARYEGRSLPPGVLEAAAVATTTYDAARGDFAGGQLAMKTRSGRDRFDGSVQGKLADPRFSWVDPRAGQSVPQNLNWDGAVSGPIRRGSAYYNFGFSEAVERRDLVSLLSLSEAQRAQQGLVPDSLVAVQQTLTGQGIPTTVSGIPDRATSRTRSALLRVDIVPSPTTTLTFTGSAGDTRRVGDGVSPLSFPSMGSEDRSRNLRGQLSASAYVRGFVTELSATVQRTVSAAGPVIVLPSGGVRVGTQYANGTTGLTDLSFGGGAADRVRSAAWTWDVQSQLSRVTADDRHKFSVGQSLSLASSLTGNAAQAFGRFTYRSVEDLAANHPASYSRTLSSAERSTKAATSAVWLKAESRVVPDRLQIQYGLRLDFIHARTLPPYNPVADSIFGRRTDRIPNPMGLSPRFGFNWVPRPAQTTRAARAGSSTPSTPMSVSGGVGAFRGVIPLDRIAGMVDAAGLPSSARQLTCIEEATPVPDWTALTAGSAPAPTQCADGGAPVAFSSDVPRLQFLHPEYRPPMSWRGNVKVEGVTVAGWRVEVGTTYSHTLHAESAVDLNRFLSPAFELVDEAERPVFVPPANIVPSTGAVAPGGLRLTEQFGRVSEYRADLQSRAIQLGFQAKQERFLGAMPLTFGYTYSFVRQQERGFDGTTAGDPFTAEWVRGPDAAHQFRLQSEFKIPLATVNLDLALSSGQSYTPMVVGDVNGDGMNNDRAFVVDPAASSDAVLAQQMQGLLASATPATRACLESQLGRIAGRNSCLTGWRLQPNMRFDLRLPLHPPRLTDPSVNRAALSDRLKVSVTTTNAVSTLLFVSGLSKILGLSNTSRRVLSGVSYPLDPNLLYVDGFDPDTRQFRYRVNQQFGEGHPQRIPNDNKRPPVAYPGAFQVQLGARLQLGPVDRPRPLVQELNLVAASPALPAPTAAEVRERLRRLTQDPIGKLLELRDSLLLSGEQIRQLEARQTAFTARADSVLEPLLAYVVKHGRKASDKRVRKLVAEAQRAMKPVILETIREMLAELRDEQRQRVPPPLRDVVVLPPDVAPLMNWAHG